MKNKENYLLYGLLVFVIAVFLYSLFSFFGLGTSTNTVDNTIQHNAMQPKKMSMGLTSFDKQLARQFMDKDNDGKCDACGMPVEMCMDTGQLQCNMDPKSTIDVLGSTHIHADWKVYINGKEFDWSPYADRHERQMKGDKSILDTSAFIHIHPAQAPEKAGDILHMHGTGIPLWIFFDSIGLELPSSIKVSVNRKLNKDGLNYVFNDLDKILITDGSGNLSEQLNSITDFAKNH